MSSPTVIRTVKYIYMSTERSSSPPLSSRRNKPNSFDVFFYLIDLTLSSLILPDFFLGISKYHSAICRSYAARSPAEHLQPTLFSPSCPIQQTSLFQLDPPRLPFIPEYHSAICRSCAARSPAEHLQPTLFSPSFFPFSETPTSSSISYVRDSSISQANSAIPSTFVFL